MDELLISLQSANGIELLLDEVFDGLDVVVGHSLYVFDALRILLREITVEVAEPVVADRESLQLRQGQMNEGNEILHLYADAIADEGVFGEVCSQCGSLASVSSVDGRHGSQHVQFHIIYNV